jgi:hypothetical protein
MALRLQVSQREQTCWAWLVSTFILGPTIHRLSPSQPHTSFVSFFKSFESISMRETRISKDKHLGTIESTFSTTASHNASLGCCFKLFDRRGVRCFCRQFGGSAKPPFDVIWTHGADMELGSTPTRCVREALRLPVLMDLYIYLLYVLVNKILSSILNSFAPIHPLYHSLSTLSIVGPTCHFI